MMAYLLAALGTTVDEGGLVDSAPEDAVAEAVGGAPGFCPVLFTGLSPRQD
jgi:methylmalonyl-CoA mutase cobalamin-binding subunit